MTLAPIAIVVVLAANQYVSALATKLIVDSSATERNVVPYVAVQPDCPASATQNVFSVTTE